MLPLSIMIKDLLDLEPKTTQSEYTVRPLNGSIGIAEKYNVYLGDEIVLKLNAKGECADKEDVAAAKYWSDDGYKAAWDFAQSWKQFSDLRRSLDEKVEAAISQVRKKEPKTAEILEPIYELFSQLYTQDFVSISTVLQRIKKYLPELYPKFGYVYLIPEPGGSFKIGKTINLEQRIKTHGVKLPYKDVKYTHTFPCGDMSQSEAALHRFYAPQRLNGEWFLLNEQQLECFKQIQYCDDIETMLDALPLPTEELRARAKAERNKEE